jgi:hypothetical protein
MLHASQQPTQDIIIGLCLEAANNFCEQPKRLRAADVTIIPDTTTDVTLYDRTIVSRTTICAGYASKKNKKSSRLSLEQMRFLVCAYALKTDCAADKLSPESAEMKLLGTTAAQAKYPRSEYIWGATTATGLPLFRLHERLDSYTIKSHFSKTNHAATVQAVTRLERINTLSLAERLPEDLSATQLRDQLLEYGVGVAGHKVAALRASLVILRAKTPEELAGMRAQAQLVATRKLIDKRLAAMKVAEVREAAGWPQPFQVRPAQGP